MELRLIKEIVWSEKEIKDFFHGLWGLWRISKNLIPFVTGERGRKGYLEIHWLKNITNFLKDTNL